MLIVIKNDYLKLILRINLVIRIMRLVGPSTRIRNTKKGKVPLGQEVINKFFYISLIDHENTLCIQMNI